MLHTFYRSSTGNVTIDLPATEWRTALHDQTGVLWVDFNAEPLADGRATAARHVWLSCPGH